MAMFSFDFSAPVPDDAKNAVIVIGYSIKQLVSKAHFIIQPSLHHFDIFFLRDFVEAELV